MSSEGDVEAALPLLRRRGVGDEENGASAAPVRDTITLRIKTTGDAREYKFDADPAGSIAQLKQQVARVIGAEGKFLRLIAAGKMLAPDTSRLSDFKVAENSFVHCVVTAAAPRTPLPLPSVDSRDDAEDSSEDEEDPAEASRRRGFDRLRSQGLSRGEVNALRGYFSAQVREFGAALGTEGTVEGETDWDRQMRHEEAWIAQQGGQSEFALNTSRNRRDASSSPYRLNFNMAASEDRPDIGTTRDFAFGFTMGFFLGFIMLFWLWESSCPQRQKLGILAGVSTQLGLNFIRRAWAVTPSESGGD